MIKKGIDYDVLIAVEARTTVNRYRSQCGLAKKDNRHG